MPLNPNYSGVEQKIQISEVNGLQSAIDSNLPTTPDGLVSGDVWSNSGVLTIIA
jgi:hypothetical protein